MRAKNCARFLSVALGCATLLVGASRSEAGAIYTYTDLGTLPGDDASMATGINSSGVVVGESFDSKSYTEQAFLYHDGTMTGLGIQGPATAINDSGVIMGYDDSRGEGFVYEHGVEMPLPRDSAFQLSVSPTIDINNSGQMLLSSPIAGSEIINPDGTVKAIVNPLGGLPALASSINNSGQAVGLIYTSSPAQPHAFLYSDGAVTDLGAKFDSARSGSRGTMGASINDAAQVLINPLNNNVMNAPAIYDIKTGTITNIPLLRGTTSALGDALNNHGQVAGTASGTSNHIFLYSAGVLQDLTPLIPDSAHWSSFTITGMNDAGQIVGYGTDSSGKDHGFLLSPQANVPEPTTLACWGLAALGLAIRARGRRRR
jgi:probable HAF family extracellular repeat protein